MLEWNQVQRTTCFIFLLLSCICQVTLSSRASGLNFVFCILYVFLFLFQCLSVCLLPKLAKIPTSESEIQILGFNQNNIKMLNALWAMATQIKFRQPYPTRFGQLCPTQFQPKCLRTYTISSCCYSWLIRRLKPKKNYDFKKCLS